MSTLFTSPAYIEQYEHCGRHMAYIRLANGEVYPFFTKTQGLKEIYKLLSSSQICEEERDHLKSEVGKLAIPYDGKGYAEELGVPEEAIEQALQNLSCEIKKIWETMVGATTPANYN